MSYAWGSYLHSKITHHGYMSLKLNMQRLHKNTSVKCFVRRKIWIFRSFSFKQKRKNVSFVTTVPPRLCCVQQTLRWCLLNTAQILSIVQSVCWFHKAEQFCNTIWLCCAAVVPCLFSSHSVNLCCSRPLNCVYRNNNEMKRAAVQYMPQLI